MINFTGVKKIKCILKKWVGDDKYKCYWYN